MKKVFVFIFLLAGIKSLGQSYSETPGSSIKIQAGFAHDFPGLNGLLAGVEFNKPMSRRLQAGLAIKRYVLSGTPRTDVVKEYTKSTTIDFNVYFIPTNSDVHLVKLGAGYSFSFYNILRSYPVYHGTNQPGEVAWPTTAKQGRVSGLILMGEYEYLIPGSAFSIGIKAAYGKAYDHVTSVAPFAGFHF